MFRQEEENDTYYWMSFTDLALGFLIVFIVIALTSMVYQQEAEEPRESAKAPEAILQGKYVELQSIFDNKLSSVPGIEITEDATIRFVLTGSEAEELFQQGEYDPTPYTEELLQSFVPVFFDEVLDIYQNRKDSFLIKEIRIEGHTDSKGSYENNLHYSSARAVKILRLIQKDKHFLKYPSDFRDFIQYNAVACGYSETRLLDYNGNLVVESGLREDRDKSRRVEFRALLEYQQ